MSSPERLKSKFLSKIYELLEPGDEIMVDKGFSIVADYLEKDWFT
jgi:hypothetical protein